MSLLSQAPDPQSWVVESIVGMALVVVVGMFLRHLRAMTDQHGKVAERAVSALEQNTKASTRLEETLSADREVLRTMAIENREQTQILRDLAAITRERARSRGESHQ